jgi:uncharacterized membrane protein YagU involved in acid resistance
MHYFWNKEPEPDPLKGLAAGLLGGLAGSMAMHLFQYTVKQLTHTQPRQRRRTAPIEDWSRTAPSSMPPEENLHTTVYDHPDPPRVEVVDAVSENVFHTHLPDRYRNLAGEAVYVGFGTSLGGAYGILAEYCPDAGLAQGTLFGTGLMLASDEVASPLLGLSDPPNKYPPSTHLYALGSHLVYGVTCELVRQGLRRLL